MDYEEQKKHQTITNKHNKLCEFQKTDLIRR